MAFAASEFEIINKVVVFDPELCSVTISKVCDGTGERITSTKTATDGNCAAAYTVANSQWNTDCKGATIRKAIIQELEANTAEW